MRFVFVGRTRRIWKRLAAYIYTFGISRRVWLVRINKEVDGHDLLHLNHGMNVFLAILPIIGPLILQFQTAKRVEGMVVDSPVRYPAIVAAAGFIPILGNLFFIGFTQDRLNKFWAHEKLHPEHGIEIDIDLSNEPGFIAEFEAAKKRSHKAGSRYGSRAEARRERIANLRTDWEKVQEERLAVRRAGGSTPILPWKRPQRPPLHRLSVTCTNCDTRFAVTRDPTAETSIVCPKCGQAEVLPSLRQDPLARKRDPVAVPAIKVTCPDCKLAFHAAKKAGKNDITCPRCGHAETITV